MPWRKIASEFRIQSYTSNLLILVWYSDLKFLNCACHADLRNFKSITLAVREIDMDEKTRTELEAAVFRRLVAHLRARTDVQNIDLMTVGGFCRNCLGDWYREAAAEKGIDMAKDTARELVYGMAQAEWKARYQKEVTPEQQAAFEKASSSEAVGHEK